MLSVVYDLLLMCMCNCGCMYSCLSRCVSKIAVHVVGTLSKQERCQANVFVLVYACGCTYICVCIVKVASQSTAAGVRMLCVSGGCCCLAV